MAQFATEAPPGKAGVIILGRKPADENSPEKNGQLLSLRTYDCSVQFILDLILTQSLSGYCPQRVSRRLSIDRDRGLRQPGGWIGFLGGSTTLKLWQIQSERPLHRNWIDSLTCRSASGPRADSQAPSRATAGSAAIFGVSAPPAIGHTRSGGASCEVVGATVARSKANASFPFAAQIARACSP